MHDDSSRGIDCQSRCILDAVVCLDKLDPELAQVDGLAVSDHFPSGASHQVVFCKLLLDNTHGKLCGIDWKIHLPQYIRQCSDMVFMSMGNDESLNLLDIVFQISDIRNHKIDSQHVVFRECQSAVHDNNTVFIFEGSDVHSDFFQSSERNDTQFSIVFFFQIYTSTCFSVLFCLSRHSLHCP